MISYDSRDWLKALALHKSDTFRKLFPALVVVGLFAWGICYLETAYLRLPSEHLVRNLPVMHSLLGFAISMLLVFRTNTAYDRWWEARKLWGELVNVSRNVAIKIETIFPPDDDAARVFYATLIGRFAKELASHLRSEKTRTELGDETLPELAGIDRSKHVPSQIARLMHDRMHRAFRDARVDGHQMIGLASDLAVFMNICGACERIKNTPIPYSYTTFLKKFIVIYVFTLPFGFVFSLGYLTIPVVVFVFYVLASLELIAEEIEDPFGMDSNDLPLDRLATMIAANATDLLARGRDDVGGRVSALP
jgi:ion channel-forming bestrophin family protein